MEKTGMTPPQLRKSADRSYDVLASADELRELFRLLGFKHLSGSPSSIFSDRWTHDSPQGRTALVYFEDMRRLVLLGPPVPQVDALAESGVMI